MDKKISRLRRAVSTRRKISELRVHRLSIYRSNLHIYANIISPEGDRVLVSASTLEPEVRKELASKNVNGGNVAAARSEEHTSELQSLMRTSYAVLCLTKKNHKPNYNNHTQI